MKTAMKYLTIHTCTLESGLETYLSLTDKITGPVNLTRMKNDIWRWTHGFERFDMKLNFHWWTQWRWDSNKTKTCWLSLWAVADAHSVGTCYFEDDIKGITDDKQMGLRVFIWIIIIIYEHNGDNTLWRRKTVGRCCGLSLTVTMSWVVVMYHIIFRIRRGWFCYICIEVKYWWLNSGLVPPNFSDMKRFILLWVFIEVKDIFYCWLYESYQIPFHFLQGLFIQQIYHLIIIFVVALLFVII